VRHHHRLCVLDSRRNPVVLAMTQGDKDILIGIALAFAALVVFGVIAAIPYQLHSVGIADFVESSTTPIMTIKLLLAAGMYGMIFLAIAIKLRRRGRK